MKPFALPQSLFEMLPAIGEQMGSIDSIIDERFPHISKKIIFLWGSTECLQYIENDLLHHSPTPDRPIRQGFPLQVLLELDIIHKEHQRQFPHITSDLIIRKNDPWSRT